MNAQQIEALLREYPTPCYVFDLEVLRRRVNHLRSSLPEGVALCYAMKANPFVTGALEKNVESFEVCSPGEYRICRAMDLPPEKLVISGVYKSLTDTAEMVEQFPEMTYTVESPAQLELLNRCAQASGKRLRVLLRLTSGNQFGMDEGVLRQVIARRRERLWLCFSGIQYFSGTQKTLRKLKRELSRLETLLVDLEAQYGYRPEELEYGPGFPVTYFQSDELDEEVLLREFSELLQPLLERVPMKLELGRSIAASCGTYLTQVVDAKTNRGEHYAILDGGIHHLVYYGQTMAMKLPHYQLIPERKGEAKPWTLCGSLCTVNDILVKQVPAADLHIGDVFAFERTGAYSMTEGLSLFLSRDLPGVVFLHEDGHFELIRPQTPTYPLNHPHFE